MTISKAKQLLKRAREAKSQLERHLVVAAAIREGLGVLAVVVGGTAEEFWTAAEYHETDLDICAPLDARSERILRELGFEKPAGARHWYQSALDVAVEFPSTQFIGDEKRLHEEDLGEAKALLLGLDDLYLDRLRQSTVTDRTTGMEFQSALAVASARYEEIDWRYVDENIADIAKSDPLVGERMKKFNSLVKRRARRALSG